MSDPQTKVTEKREANFRQDLVGLRGVAVLAVLLHHFEIPGFVGAFYGPDIFFVLSGFLITGSLVREYGRNLERTGKGSISFIGLYLRRARRIIPAATAVIIAINIYAYFFINEIRQHTILIDSIWTFFFGANIRFLNEATDYFSTDGVSPLVHFWSLSVTEQFYVFWPLLLLFAAKLRIPNLSSRSEAWKKQMIIVLTVLIAASFAWFLIVFGESANRAYFSTFCRAWELAIGGAIAILTFREVHGLSRKAVAVARNIGLLLLFGSVLIVTPDNFGYTIFIPVLACSFIIFTGKYFPADLSSKTLGSLPLRSLGTISYSVYLWHWPVFVFAHNLGWMDTVFNKFIGISVTLILGTATYFLVEQTFMRIPIPKDAKFAKENLTTKQLWAKRILSSGAILFVVMLVGYAMFKPQIVHLLKGSSTKNEVVRTVNEAFNSDYSYTSKKIEWADWPATIDAGSKLSELPDELHSQFVRLGIKPTWKSHGFDCIEIRVKNYSDCKSGSQQSSQNPKAPKVVILGSSFAEALVPAVAAVFDPTKYNLRGFVMPMCSVAEVHNLQKDGSVYTDCLNYRPWAFNEIAKLQPDYIVMSSNLRFIKNATNSEIEAGLVQSLQELKKTGAKLIVVGTMPATGNLPVCLVGKTGFGESCFTSPADDQYLRDIERKASHKVGGTYVEPSNWICINDVCPPVINNQIVSWDGAHITTWFSKYVGRFLKQQLIDEGVISGN